MEYITITGIQHYFGLEAFKVNQILWIKKDLENEYDDEAIKVVTDTGIVCGYVANSVYTVARGTKSAGRIYDRFETKCKIMVKFITKHEVIAQLIFEQEEI